MAEKKKKWDLEAISEFFHNLFVKNIQTKLIVLLITIIIWSFTMLRNEYTTKMNVPFEVVNIEEGKILKNRVPEQIRAQFHGDGLDFFFLLFQSRSSFRLILDLSTIKWFYNFDLNDYYDRHPEYVFLPRNSDVRLINVIEPESLYVELDKKVIQKVSVRSQIVTVLEPGYTKYELDIEPDSVTVTGPSSYLREIQYINTIKKVKEDVVSSINMTVPLQKFETKNITMNPGKVQVAQVVDQIGEKSISGIPVNIVNPPKQGQVEVHPNKVTVYISGGFNKIKAVESEDINVYVDLKGRIDNGQKSYQLQVKSPGNYLEITKIEPSSINVRLIEERN
ncbi:MAG TPA: CdaR family protein [bacterium]|nr:CdaR family protein [bacterium]